MNALKTHTGCPRKICYVVVECFEVSSPLLLVQFFIPASFTVL